MTTPGNSQQQIPSKVTGWLRPEQALAGPGRWIPFLAVLTVIIYHLAWMLSARPYLSPALVVLGAALLLLVGLTLLGRVKGGLVTLRGSIYYFMTLAGVVAAIWGATELYRAGAGDAGRTGELVGTITLISGVFVAAAGVFLRPANSGVSAHKAPQDFAAEAVSLSGETAMVHRSRSGFGAGANERIVGLAKEVVRCEDLHYLALHVEGGCAFYVDVFNDKRLETLFTVATQEKRREEYLRIASYLDEWLPGMNRSFDGIDVGILIRVVLDVEQGALYYYRVDKRRFMIGVTLDQEVVNKTDTIMTKLVKETQRMLGHRQSEELNDS